MMENNLAPIVLFVYARPEHTRKTLEALYKDPLAKNSELYIFADGAKNATDSSTLLRIEETRNIIEEKQWCAKVHIKISSDNKGLAQSILEGVTDVVNRYGKIIVLEDDIVISPLFLTYMNQALDMYQEDKRVMHISSFVPQTSGVGDLPDTYFLRFMSCWGWATWKDAWDEIILDTDYLYEILPSQPDFAAFNLEGAIDMFSQIEENYKGTLKTWAIKWYSTIFLNKGLCLYPKYSLSANIGMDGSGENSYAPDDRYEVDLNQALNLYRSEMVESLVGKEYLKRFYRYGRHSAFGDRIKQDLRNSNFVSSVKKTWLYKIYSKYRYSDI